MKRLLSRAVVSAFALATLAPFASAYAQASASNHTTGYRYDMSQRLVGTIAPDPDGSGGIRYAAVRNIYDARGLLIKTEKGELANWQPETVAPNNWPGFTIFQTVDIGYDADGQKIKELVSGGGVPQTLTQFSYHGNGRLLCTAVRMNVAAFASAPTDACQHGAAGSFGPDRITKTIYNLGGHLITVQKAFGTPLQQDYAGYSYTVNGKQASVTDANGTRASYSYDEHDRLARWNFPSKATVGVTSTTDYEDYGYDANGNRTSLRKRDGSTLTYQYDALNRMTKKVVPERAGLDATHTRDVHYGYDLRGLQTYARFDSASGEGITDSYDGLGRKTASSLTIDGVSRTISHQYDKNGNRTQVTHPDSIYFAMAYDGLDRMANASWWLPGHGMVPFVAINYNDKGMRSTINRASSFTDYGYDTLGRLNLLPHRFTGGVANVTTNFSHNPASQIVSRTTSNDDYAFNDGVVVARTYQVNGLNQYTTAGPASFTYDANGNLNSDGSTNYLYDVENRLVSASGSANANLRYDPLGRLYEVGSVAGGATRFLYDGDQLAAEYSSGGQLLRRYFWGPGGDEPIMWDEGAAMNCSGSRFLHPNHQGSIIAMADCWGNKIAINSYDEWGIPAATNNENGIPVTTNTGRFQYTGQAWIPELGMYYYKARIYSPTLGRFMQTDPIGYKDQANLYAYVGNDPVNRTDPSGKWTCEKNSKEACKTFSVALKGLQRLAASQSTLAAQSKMRQSLSAYGKEGVANGVVISSGSISSGASTNTEGGVTTVTFNSAWFSSSTYFGMTQAMRTSFSATVAHEGRHVYDHRENFGVSNPRNAQEYYDTERQAYFEQGQLMRATEWRGAMWRPGMGDGEMGAEARKRAWYACQGSKFSKSCSGIDAW